MAVRIGDYVKGGELGNRTPNRVDGWLEMTSGRRIKVELTGDLAGQFKGRAFCFSVPIPPDDELDPVPGFITAMTEIQSGAVGSVCFRTVKHPAVRIVELLKSKGSKDGSRWIEKPMLFLEWFGPHQRVVAEILDADIEFVDVGDGSSDIPTPEPLIEHDPADGSGVSVTGFTLNDEGESTIEELTDSKEGGPQDEYGLFHPNLAALIGQSLDSGHLDGRNQGERPPAAPPDEMMVPLEFKEMIQARVEELEAMLQEDAEVPIGELLDPPLRLPPMDQVTSDEQAEPLLEMILDRLHEYAIEVGDCDHATPLNKYQVVVNGILPDAKVDPKFKKGGQSMNYCMWAYCPECLAEFDGE